MLIFVNKTFKNPKITAKSQQRFPFPQCLNNKHTARQNSNKFAVIEIQYNDLRAILEILRRPDSQNSFIILNLVNNKSSLDLLIKEAILKRQIKDLAAISISCGNDEVAPVEGYVLNYQNDLYNLFVKIPVFLIFLDSPRLS